MNGSAGSPVTPVAGAPRGSAVNKYHVQPHLKNYHDDSDVVRILKCFMSVLPMTLLVWSLFSAPFYQQGTNCTGKTGKIGKMTKRNSLSGKTQGIWKFCQTTGNFVCSSCKFPDSKGKGYCVYCSENLHFFKNNNVCQISFLCM